MSFSDSLKKATTSYNEQRKNSEIEDSKNNGIALINDDDENWVKPENSSKYDYYDNEYYDENVSLVDDNKTITLDKSQINLTQEKNSQYIPFRMSRYYDGFDLSQTKLSIFWAREDGNGSYSNVVDVYCNDTKIKFALLVDGKMTAVAGKLKFEIHAEGVNSKGYEYIWKTKPNDELTVLQALETTGVIEPDETWQESFMSKVSAYADKAEAAATAATQAATEANQKVEELQNGIEQNVKDIIGDNYYTKQETLSKDEVQSKIDSIDVTDQLADYAKNTYVDTELEKYAQKDTVYTKEETLSKAEIEEKIDAIPQPDLSGYALKSEIPSTEGLASEEFVKSEIEKIDVTEQLENYYTKDDTLSKEEIEEKLNSIDVTEQLSDYAKKADVTNIESKLNIVEQTANSNKGIVTTLGTKITELEDALSEINTDPGKTYEITKDEDAEMYTLWEIENEGLETELRTEKSKFAAGGSGGGGTSSTLKIEYVTKSPLTVTLNDSALITYRFSGQDSSGDEVTEGKYTWKMNNKVIASGTAISGENTFDATEFLSIGTQKLVLSITDDAGSLVTKSWSVQKIDVRIESDFNDALTYPIGSISFSYTPYGAISKTIHIKLDGEELTTITTTSSGLPMSYTLPSQSHGSHLVEAYITAEINNSIIESNHIYKDIIWYDSSSDTPVIGCTSTNMVVKQYDTASITYTVFDPNTETPVVKLSIDGKETSTLTLESNTQIWQYKATEVGIHILTIACGSVTKTINLTVEKLDIEVTPITAGLEFDFNPTGHSNSDANRLWSDENKDVSMTVSGNFDWQNGGYQIDENGDQYFCVKSGTTAVINYNLFADDPKRSGKEFKVIFKTTNVKNRDTSFLTCMDNGIGLDMKIEKANIYSSNDSLFSPYCEDDIIEFEFNINKNTDIPMVLTYEDGTGNRPMIYTSDASFMQTSPQNITIGSDDCDVYVYRMKAYSNSLSDTDIKNNFIADARNAEEMISRYKRNQIYDENGSLTPEILAEKCPDLRVILVDCPRFTTDKSDKVSDTNITMIYKGGDSVLDSWTCTGAKVSGQGTSSNEYGYSGRNLDLIMDGDEAEFTFGDGETTGKTLTLTRNSVPTDYLNVKVNIASSENENNAQLTNRYNDYNPFKRTAKLKDSKVRDTMEFHNCVVFVRERNEDISTHNEFMDNNYHFYAIGNVGDSKKTDDLRVNDKNDPKECVIEVTDYNMPLSEFPTGKTDEDGNKIICPVSEWKSGNTAYDALYSEYKYKDGKFKSFGSESYEFRYEKDGITSEEREENIKAWQEAYKFVVTSDDDTFVSDFDKYFVKDSIFYFYLFTERYLMPDNRAKNTFYHYGKVWYSPSEAQHFKETYGTEIESIYIDETQANFNNGYRWDLAFGYDFDRLLSK